MKANLEKFLFEENARAFAVLDGAAIDDLPRRIYEMQPRVVCLYRGELAPDMAEVAPYLVELFPGDAFTEWLLNEGAGGSPNWGIFALSRFSLTEVRKHFRKFLTVYDDAGKPLLFRFYDPRVLVKFLPTCDREGLGQFFERVTSFAAENGPDGFTRMDFRNGRLNTGAI
jgi:hypothetical protein